MTQKRDLVVTRQFNAPVSLVWKAWTDSRLLMQWWGPAHFTCPSAKLDFRVGGSSIICMRLPKEFGGQDMYTTWLYTKIVPMQSLEFIQNLSDKDGNNVDPVALGVPPDFPRDQRNLVTFKSIDALKTELTVTQFDWIVGQMITLAEAGWSQSLDKLAATFS
jgi:uncharacterized protein YndB with AHSA1/START domain